MIPWYPSSWWRILCLSRPLTRILGNPDATDWNFSPIGREVHFSLFAGVFHGGSPSVHPQNHGSRSRIHDIQHPWYPTSWWWILCLSCLSDKNCREKSVFLVKNCQPASNFIFPKIGMLHTKSACLKSISRKKCKFWEKLTLYATYASQLFTPKKSSKTPLSMRKRSCL